MNKAINLIPTPILAARARRRRLRAWIVGDALAGTAIVVALVLMSPQASERVGRLRSEYEAARISLAGEQERLARLASDLRAAKAREAVQRRIGARPDFSGLLYTLGQTLDQRAFLEQVVIAPQVFGDEPAPTPPTGTPVSAAATPAAPSGAPAPSPHERYQLLISGVALNMATVSDVVLRLDESGYFAHVGPATTTAREVGTVRGVEFKIVATLGEGRLAGVDVSRGTDGEGAP